jgi:MFS family permease
VPPRPVSWGGALGSLRRRTVVLADLGYVGHMWELYAMWALVAALLASLGARSVSLLAFVCIGAGAFGCLAGGVLSDRYGRARAAYLSLVCSGLACLVLGLAYGALPLWLAVVVCAWWGFWVIADSAQFSAIVSEAADPADVGSALSFQLALGYLTTVAALSLLPSVAEHSWRAALLLMALGPLLGALAVRRIVT